MDGSPQLENGYARIANELLEVLAETTLTAYEFKAIILIIRKSYGFQRKEWTIKKWKEFEKIGIKKTHIKRTLSMLCDRKMIKIEGKTITFNKYYNEWVNIETGNYYNREKVTSRGNFSNVDNYVDNSIRGDKKVTSRGNFSTKKLPHEVTKKLPHEVTQVTSSGNFCISENSEKSDDKPIYNNGLQNWHESCDLKENLKKDLKENIVLNIDPGSGTTNFSIEKKDDGSEKNPEKRGKDLARLENYLNAKCSTKWNGKLHCEKFPDGEFRLKILDYYNSGTRSMVHRTIDGKIKTTEKEELLEEFVYKSILQSIEKNESYYER